eukprot:534130-Pelagomonas_calceolata.AAC.2
MSTWPAVLYPRLSKERYRCRGLLENEGKNAHSNKAGTFIHIFPEVDPSKMGMLLHAPSIGGTTSGTLDFSCKV